MKNLYDAARVDELKSRMARLRPNSTRQWGKMNVAQALAHCSGAMAWAVGDTRPPRAFVGRLVGGIIKGKVLGDDEPFRRGSPTTKDLMIADEREFAAERDRLLVLLDRFAATGPNGCTTHPHTFFGRLTPQQWAILMYKHLDHHLRQFGV